MTEAESHFNHSELPIVTLHETFHFLEFENDDHFWEAYQVIYDQQANRSLSFFANFLNFTTQYEAFESIDEEAEFEVVAQSPKTHPYRSFLYISVDTTTREMEAKRVVSSPILAQMVNQDGLIKIGDKVQRFLPAKIMSATSPSAEEIQQMITWEEGTDLAFVEFTEIQSNVLPASTSRSLMVQCTLTYPKGSRLFRVKGEQRYTFSTPGSSFTREWNVSTSHQIRRFGVWFADRADLELAFTGTFKIGNNGSSTVRDLVFTTRENQTSFEETLAFCSETRNDSNPGPCQGEGIIWETDAVADHGAFQDADGTTCTTTW